VQRGQRESLNVGSKSNQTSLAVSYVGKGLTEFSDCKANFDVKGQNSS